MNLTEIKERCERAQSLFPANKRQEIEDCAALLAAVEKLKAAGEALATTMGYYADPEGDDPDEAAAALEQYRAVLEEVMGG